MRQMIFSVNDIIFVKQNIATRFLEIMSEAKLMRICGTLDENTINYYFDKLKNWLCLETKAIIS